MAERKKRATGRKARAAGGKARASKTASNVPLVSVVLSFRNEEAVLPELIRRLEDVFAKRPEGYELIFVNDDSTDGSTDVLTAARAKNERIKIINMSRCFGHYECVLAGVSHAAGDAVVNMDTDLQDPPEVIPEMIEQWRQGAEVVYTVRTRRDGESAFRMMMTKAAYRMIHRFSKVSLPVEAGDFKLLSRRAVVELLRLKETQPYLRGLMMWVGFKQVPVYYQRAPRQAGETHFPGTFSLGALESFMAGITSFSMVPLYLVLVAGLAGMGVAVLGLVAMLLPLPFPDGWAVIAFALFLWGGLMAALGVVAVYISRIYNDVRGRPSYIIKDTVGFTQEDR